MPTNEHLTLRRVLHLNATTSALSGLAALVAGPAVAELLGVDAVGLVRLVGAGLALFAGAVTMLARADDAILLRYAREVSRADAAWVAGTTLTIASGWYSTRGALVMAGVGVVVGGYAIAQWRLSGAIETTRPATGP